MAVYVYEQPILQVHCIDCSVPAVYTAWHCRYTAGTLHFGLGSLRPDPHFELANYIGPVVQKLGSFLNKHAAHLLLSKLIRVSDCWFWELNRLWLEDNGSVCIWIHQNMEYGVPRVANIQNIADIQFLRGLPKRHLKSEMYLMFKWQYTYYYIHCWRWL